MKKKNYRDFPNNNIHVLAWDSIEENMWICVVVNVISFMKMPNSTDYTTRTLN